MATIKFGIPDVPYSQVEYDTTEISEVDAINLAKAFREQFLIVMGAQQAQPPQRPAPRPAGNGAPRNGNGGSKAHSGLFCPDHDGVELIPSKAEYQEYSYDADGNQRPEKFFCPGEANGDKNHSVWRSRALTREVVEDLPF